MKKKTISRRQLVKKAQYIAPLVLTLKATPSFAKSGSEKTDDSVNTGRFKRRSR